MQHDLREAHIAEALLGRELGEVLFQQRGPEFVAHGVVHHMIGGAMRGTHTAGTRKSEQGFELSCDVGLIEGFGFPFSDGLMLQRGAGGGANIAVGAAEMRPGGGDGFWV